MTRGERARRRGLAAIALAIVLLGAAALLLLRREPSTAPNSSAPLPSSPPPAPLRVDWGGCADVRLRDDAPLCLVHPERPLRLWIEGAPVDRLEVLIDGEPASAERYVVDGETGAGLRVAVPAGAAALAVRMAGAEPADAAWSLSLGELAEEPPNEARLRAQKEIAAAVEARDGDRARRAAERAHDLALEQGYLRLAVDMALLTVHHMSQRRLDPEATAGLLQHVEATARRYPKGRGDLACYRGVYQWSLGANQDAAESLREAVRDARRLEDRELAADSIPIYADALARLGYFDDALRWAREGVSIVRAREDHCNLGSVLRTAGWVSLGLRRRGRDHDDPARLLGEALALFGEGGRCPKPRKLGGARLSLALLALDEGRLADAAVQLEQIDRGRLTRDERLHMDETALRLLLAQREPPERLRAAHRGLQATVDAIDTADARWRLHTLRGRMLEREGDDEGALAAQRAAELELDALVRLQAVGIGRGELADRYHESTEALVSLLVHRGEVGEAWCVVRQDQARRRAAAAAPTALEDAARESIELTIRHYRTAKLTADSLEGRAVDMPRDEAERVQQTAAEARERARALAHEITKALAGLAPNPRCTELSPAAPGELLLGLYPRAHDWLVFASDAKGTSVHVVPTPRLDDPLETLARALLEPVGARLDAAKRVRVLAHREAQRLDVHRLPWRGEPLVARLPVGYGVELPVRRAAAPQTVRRALLVADPTGTLAGAEAEVALVNERLTAAGWSTAVSDALEPGAVSLAGYDLFHYAGHAEASVRPEQGGWPPHPGGEAGWAGFLELGKAGQLTVHDVTTMSAVPRATVLAGCRTGALDLDTGQTSLALAFLVAGSEQVIASEKAVDDARGARFARGFYEALVREPEVDLVVAMQRAQRGLWEAGEELAGYRVWVR